MPTHWITVTVACLVLAACAACSSSEDYEGAFRKRADFFIRQTAARDTDAMIAWFDQVDYFKGAGGDRHKYILPPIIAKLHLDPGDEKGLRAYRMLMAVDKRKGDRGLYHFAAFQRARLYFDGRGKLPRDVMESNEYDVRNHFDILRRGGTENHEFMHRGSGLIFAEHVTGPYANTRRTREQHLSELRDWLKSQVRRFYTIRVDSSTVTPNANSPKEVRTTVIANPSHDLGCVHVVRTKD